ncbi:MAG: hypothetical protein ABIC04_02605 [Nanoarchaeota archaeon]
MLDFKKPPKEIITILDLFNNSQIQYNLFKCEKYFSGLGSNIDIVIRTDSDYDKASRLLEKKNYVLYLSEKIERYKKMYVLITKNTILAIHLHREIAWHGIKVLNKEDIFQNQRKINKHYFIPSNEDSLLIHIGHILFENFKIEKFENELIQSLLSSTLNWNYIDTKLDENGWKSEFYKLLAHLKSKRRIKKFFCVKAIFYKCFRRNTSPIFYLLDKTLRRTVRLLSLKRRGCLIALIGVNGSGKTTLTLKTLEKFKPITGFINGQFGYYFGWDPFFIVTKFISKILKQKNTKIYDKLKDNKFSLYKEIIFIYQYIEYLIRYIFIIYPRLRKNQLIVTDRYFFDIFGQNDYAEKSKIIWFLMSIYPKPDFLFILDARLESLIKRDKNPELLSKNVKRTKLRKLHNTKDLLSQKTRYKILRRVFKGDFINTEKDSNYNVDQIIKKSSGKLISR